MLRRATPMEGSGEQIILDAADDLIVPLGVGLRSLDSNAVLCEGFVAGVAEAVDIRVDGSVAANGGQAALVVDSLQMEDSASVTIGARGLVSGPAAISIGGASGSQAEIVNHGNIVATLLGIVSSSTFTHIVNTGRIIAGSYAVYISPLNPNAQLTLENAGYIGQGPIVGGGGNDVIRNTGALGPITFGTGNDLYLGRLGRVTGAIDGGAGADRFTLGAGRESVDGGDGVDTVDFRGGAAVTLDLADMSRSTGRARGDTYLNVEIFQGSGYNDILRGASGNDILNGNGGADRIAGRAGIDALSGGAGRDTLSGGAGDDTFLFRSLKDGADIITDFTSNGGANANDTIAIVASGFGAGLMAGMLDPARFRSGSSNAAHDRDDRFIFRKGDASLWFDADGSGRKAPVLIADLQNGSLMTAADIVIY